MELIHICYRVTDVDRSLAFYEELGFEERRRMPIRVRLGGVRERT
jgi:lactoylglutathione lyase